MKVGHRLSLPEPLKSVAKAVSKGDGRGGGGASDVDVGLSTDTVMAVGRVLAALLGTLLPSLGGALSVSLPAAATCRSRLGNGAGTAAAAWFRLGTDIVVTGRSAPNSGRGVSRGGEDVMRADGAS